MFMKERQHLLPLGDTFLPLHDFWMPPVFVLACLTLVIGNVTALYQKNFKRMLAYSSISHVGYLLFALITWSADSSNNVLVYATAYTFATITAFGTLILVKQKTGADLLKVIMDWQRKILLLHLHLQFPCYHLPVFL
jgi:NADH:ubiquinone oxidoreductase subunit 2 (subunit N)